METIGNSSNDPNKEVKSFSISCGWRNQHYKFFMYSMFQAEALIPCPTAVMQQSQKKFQRTGYIKNHGKMFLAKIPSAATAQYCSKFLTTAHLPNKSYLRNFSVSNRPWFKESKNKLFVSFLTFTFTDVLFKKSLYLKIAIHEFTIAMDTL